jgi:hypothetical protein
MAIDISDHLRSEEGKRRGGHTRRVHESGWGKMEAASAKNATGRGEPAYNTAIGSHGLKSAGAPRARVAVQPAGMKGRR